MRGTAGDDPDDPDDEAAGDAPERSADARDGSVDAEPGAAASQSRTAGSPADDPGGSERSGTANGSDDATSTGAEIDPSELTVSERSLHPRIRILWIVRAVLWASVLGAIAAAVTWQWLAVGPVLPATITAVLLVLFVSHAILRYRAWQYEFREDAIYLERGVLTRVRTVVPFVRIQHVDTARGPIQRAVGLSTLVVYTAGSRGADVTIPGIEADRATDHQRRLKQLAIAAEDDTAV